MTSYYHHIRTNYLHDDFEKKPGFFSNLARQTSLPLNFWPSGPRLLSAQKNWTFRSLLSARLGLIVLWVITLWWGEDYVFRRDVRNCAWEGWESWPPGAEQHRIILVADPQLVDPHTYPGRPWPLSSLTIRHTDLYLRKSFQLLQEVLDPDTVIFLGDLFDGGREWATPKSESPEKAWKKYGEDFWLQEYDRFGGIFFARWNQGVSRPERSRKILAGLPGNHDLGIGTGIQLPVRDRFNAFFGDGNRIDIIGNHTIVSVDTVSLSAHGESDPVTGSQGAGEGEGPNSKIWGPTEQFLTDAKATKARAINRILRLQAGKTENERQNHTVLELLEPLALNVPLPNTVQELPDIPSILLTHVPLYRAPDTPCGPLRESGSNAIAVQKGYQYQNVLAQSISSELIEKIGNVENVFSGDDHDYCEVIHKGYTPKAGGIREITVKSMSWAMGVRKPGFLMLSLWNPIDSYGNAITAGHVVNSDGGRAKTVQTHLCLLPDQLSIFTRYGFLLASTLITLIICAFLNVYGPSATSNELDSTLLPTSYRRLSSTKREPLSSLASSNSSTASHHNGLAVRSSAARTRSVSPSTSYGYGLPITATTPPTLSSDNFGPSSTSEMFDQKEWNDVPLHDTSKRKRTHGIIAVFRDFRTGIGQVAIFALLWYAWLVWHA